LPGVDARSDTKDYARVATEQHAQERTEQHAQDATEQPAQETTEQHAQETSLPELEDIVGAPPSMASAKAAGWMPPPAYLSELAEAAKRDEASFPQVFMAGLLVRDPRFGPEVNEYAESLVPRLLRGFEKRYGNVIDSRYGFTCPAGAVLLERVDAPGPDTDGTATRWSRLKHRLAARRAGIAEIPAGPLGRTPRAGDVDAFVWWKVLHFDSQDATELLAEIISLRDRITTFLPDPTPPESDARDICVRRVYALATELTESVDAEEQHWLDALTARWYESVNRPVKPTIAGVPQIRWPFTPQQQEEQQWEMQESFAYREQHRDQRPSARFVRGIASLRTRLANEERNYLAAVQRVAQRAYLDGMLKGFAALLVVLIALAVASDLIGFGAGWVTTSTLGATGAVLSVLQRLGRGLDLAPEGEKKSFRQQGFVRPWIGAVLGIASFVLLKGGLVSITTPSGTANKVLYYGGIAFLAGFSERFAQDMLVVPGVARATQHQSAEVNGSSANVT
jgi:hypothetical protein